MQDGVHDALAEMAGAAKKAKKLPACEYLRWTDAEECERSVGRVGLVHGYEAF